MGFPVPTLRYLLALPLLSFFNEPNRRAHSGLLLGLVHRFWTILGGILAGFIVLSTS